MRRRNFIFGIAGSAAMLPLAARAQQTLQVIGLLSSESSDPWTVRLEALRQGLNETGYTEGRNVAIEYRWAEGNNARLPALAADLVARRVNVIVGNGPAAVAAKAATTTTPVVFFSAGDPVARGLVQSLNRPGGNLTGVATLSLEVAPKRLELLQTILPAATTMGVLINPANFTLAETLTREVQTARKRWG